ncbi:hypothetical protein [Hippea alviniae]|uniref:hypothetical protein n=1 Tax=Hippea alviniae TaxID=1279027 RepID=UPI0003B5E9C8|nr:hypothetical protein [Hippea alviniae]
MNLTFAAEVIRKGYQPHVSLIDEIILGVFTFGLVAAVLFVRWRFSKELKKRGLKERDIRRKRKGVFRR